MWDVILDAFIDSLKLLGVVFVVYVLISFVEENLADRLKKADKLSTLIGVTFGLIPQCGFSVIASDLYRKRHISIGTLLGVFIATSDEALPVLISSGQKIIMIVPLLLIKFLYGLIIGYGIDLIYTKSKIQAEKHFEHCDHEETTHIGCCGHEIEDGDKEKPVHRYLIHPLIHSLKIFVVVLIVNIIMGIIMYFIGEENVTNFLQQGKYIAPLLSVLVGLIPNCSASVIIATLYINGGISFGATVAGLCSNAGLGLLYLFKNYKQWKTNLQVLLLLAVFGLIIGYVIIGVEALIALI